jgi:hypothetical protein
VQSSVSIANRHASLLNAYISTAKMTISSAMSLPPAYLELVEFEIDLNLVPEAELSVALFI